REQSVKYINTKTGCLKKKEHLGPDLLTVCGNAVFFCDKVKDESPEADVSGVSSPTSLPAISLLSPKAMEMAGCIIKVQEEHREKAKLALRVRQEMQEKLVAAVASAESEQLKRFEELMELKQRQEYQSMRDMMERETKESIGRQEKLKEEQRRRITLVNLRLREAEQQRLREAELERQRQAEGRESLRSLNSIQEEILQLNQLLEPSTQTKTDLPPASLSSYSTRGNQLCSQVSEVVRKTAEGNFPSLEDMTVAERALHEMRALIRLMQEEAANVREKKKKEQEQEEERRKQAELLAKQEGEKKAAQLAKEKAQRKEDILFLCIEEVFRRIDWFSIIGCNLLWIILVTMSLTFSKMSLFICLFQPVPHGLNHGWRWLAQMLNMEPLADVTATLLFDFLEVCGNALMNQYRSQFWKLILLLKEEYFPRIEAVTSSGQMGSVIRLKQFLETSLQRRQISPPRGQLGSGFWRS
uniref:mRNA export factor GLE1 n=1 Tax=Neolamprologus brichardi TaxID=32507 RepID=A0A3Q4MW54_NEOBR